MRDLMFDADVTEAQIRGKRDEVRQVQEKLEDIRLNDFLAIRSVLTADQRQKLKDVKIANSRRDGENASNPQNPAASSNPSNATAKRADNNDQKRLADTPK
jgi:Spy/CpxP family protein refolding chaperone